MQVLFGFFENNKQEARAAMPDLQEAFPHPLKENQVPEGHITSHLLRYIVLLLGAHHQQKVYRFTVLGLRLGVASQNSRCS